MLYAPAAEHLGDFVVLECWYFFFFQAEDGIRDLTVTGVQTCALPISYFLTTQWLDLRYAFGLMPWVEGVAGGALLMAACGRLAPRSVVNQPPLTPLPA